MGDDRTDAIDALEQLQVTLTAALNIATAVNGDPLLQRLLAVFHATPGDDRPVIVGVLEREILGRLLSRGTGKSVGQSLRPNPNARLYVHVHDSDYQRRELDRDNMVIADIRALRIAPIIRDVPGIRDLFKEALREALDSVEPELWSVAEDLLQDALGCIADARAAAARPPEDPPDPPAAGDPDPVHDRDAGKPTRRS